MGGLVKGCLHEDGAIGQEPGEDIFLPLVRRGNFCGRVIGYALQEDLCRKMEAEPRQDPDQVPALDILDSMLTSNPHHA